MIAIDIGGRVRHPSRLDDVAPAPDRPLDDIAAAAADAGSAGIFLTGGEPTLRADLPQLLRALDGAGMRTDGWALSAGVVRGLRGDGLAGVVIPLHSARAAAHDWLANAPGAARRAMKAIAVCASAGAGLRVEAEIVLTRPTLAHISETVEAAARLGAAAIRFRRVTARGPAATDFIALSPRLAQLLPLEHAVLRARELGLEVSIEGIPREFLGVAADAALDSGLDACSDYFERLGTGELRRPPPLQKPDAVRVHVDPAETSRAVGLRICRAAQQRSVRLRLVDAFEHPRAEEIVRDALRLDIAVEVTGEMRGLANVGPRGLLHLRMLTRVDAALRGPDAPRHDARAGREGAFAETLSALAQLHGPERGAYALIEDERELADYAEAWANGTLPGAPAFRLMPRGGSLAALARKAAEMPPPVAGAIAPLLPACVRTTDAEPFRSPDHDWWGATSGERAGSACDRFGAFDPCAQRHHCANAGRCPGIASGWSLE